jgi:hypothetical protein
MDTVSDADIPDEYGRTRSERLCVIELTPVQAERLNTEIDLGYYPDWDSAVKHKIERGFAEVTRQRKVKEKKETIEAAAVENWTRMLKANPDFVTNPAKVVQFFELLKQNRTK